MKLYYATGSSSLFPHIVFHETVVPFEPIKIDEHLKEIAARRCTCRDTIGRAIVARLWARNAVPPLNRARRLLACRNCISPFAL